MKQLTSTDIEIVSSRIAGAVANVLRDYCGDAKPNPTAAPISLPPGPVKVEGVEVIITAKAMSALRADAEKRGMTLVALVKDVALEAWAALGDRRKDWKRTGTFPSHIIGDGNTMSGFKWFASEQTRSKLPYGEPEISEFVSWAIENKYKRAFV